MKIIKEEVYYEIGDEDQPEQTATNINLIFFNLEGSRREFVGEKILFVNYLVERYQSVANE